MGGPASEVQPLQGTLQNDSIAPMELVAGRLEGGGSGGYSGRGRGKGGNVDKNDNGGIYDIDRATIPVTLA